MFNLVLKLKHLLKKEEGQAMTEYGLIIALIAVVVIAALVVLGPKLANLFVNISNSL